MADPHGTLASFLAGRATGALSLGTGGAAPLGTTALFPLRLPPHRPSASRCCEGAVVGRVAVMVG
ncbi:MAG: hypothetical protein IPH79_00610 [Sphingomonadales bacterium]|nr:hypothetical protein [Sphingomonadales bacterium]